MAIKIIKIGKLKPVEIGWLAGIVDGEGSIGLKRGKDKREGRTPMTYTPFIQITNCDFILLSEVKRILNQANIHFYFWDGREKQRNEKWADSGNIAIGCLQECIKFLELMIPYLIAKKERAIILLEFCQERLGKRKRGENGRFITTYSGKEKLLLILWGKLHKLNKKGKR